MSPPSALRLASMLGRSHCVWMASPSVALLSALVAGKARPRRLLIDQTAPAFVSNIGRVAGATLLTAGADEIDALLEETLQAEGLSPESVWAVAIHASGQLASRDRLWRSASHGIPTIELCMGSLLPLMSQGVSAATFTIVDLDAEDRFRGVGLAALLTDDRDLATRLEQFCLPGPDASNYVLNASPRGLDADEASLVRVLDEVRALAAGGLEAPASAGFLEAPRWQGMVANSADSESLWAARVAEVEARLQAQQSLAEEWQRRSEVAEREVSDRNALPLVPAVDVAADNERSRILLEKETAERDLAAMKAEMEAINRKLTRAERERDLAMLDAGGREEAERSALVESRKRVEQLEAEATATVEREAQLAAAAQAGMAELTARITRLEADGVVVAKSREMTLIQKANAEQALALARAETEALTTRLREVEADRDQSRAEALQRDDALRAALQEEKQRGDEFEKEVGELTSFATKAAKEWNLTRADLSSRLEQVQAEFVRAEQDRAALQSEKARIEQSLRAIETEGENLTERLLAIEKDRDLAWAEVEKSEEAHRTSLEEQKKRADEAEKAMEEHQERSVRLTEEWSVVRADLIDRLTQAETAAGELVRKNVDIGRSLTAAQRESKTLTETVARLEQDRDRAAAKAMGDEKALRASLEEQRQRAEALEQEVAAHKEHEDKLTTEWSVGQIRLTEQIARLETTGIGAAEANAALLAQKADLKQALAQLRAEHDSLAEKLVKAHEREAKQAAVLQEATERSAQVEKDARAQAVAAAEEAHAVTLQIVQVEKDRDQRLAEAAARGAEQLQEWSVARTEFLDQIARLEASEVRLENANTDLSARKDAALAEAKEKEKAQESLLDQQKQRVNELEADVAAQKARESERADEWSRSRAELLETVARLEERAVATGNANTELQVQKTNLEEALSSVRSDLDAALAEAAERSKDYTAALDEAQARASELASEIAARKAREGEQAEEWSTSRAEFVDRIARLEAAAVATENANTDLENQKTRLEEALSSLRAERDAQAASVLNAGKERDEALAEAAGRLKDRTTALEEVTARASELEADIAAHKAREAEQADAWSAARAEFVERIARLETAAAVTENATSDLLAAKAELEGSLSALRAASENTATRLAEAESARDAARAEATRLEEDLGLQVRGERERALSLEVEVKALLERETALTEEWSAARAELSNRVAQLEESVATAEQRQAEAVREKAEAEQILAASLAERDTAGRDLSEAARERDQRLAEAEERDAAQRLAIETHTGRVAELEKEVAAWNERELVQIRQWAELRSDLSERIARLEADEAIADKARTELLTRKRESEQAFARAEREKAAISRRFEAVEKARDRAQATVRSYETAHQELIARGASAKEWKSRFLRQSDDEEDSHRTGPLSKLMAGWSEISAQNPQGRVSRIVDESPEASLGSLIDRPLSLDEPAHGDADGEPDAPAAAESDAPREEKRQKGGRRPKTHPPPTAPVEAESPEESDQGTESHGWLRGLAKKIRGG